MAEQSSYLRHLPHALWADETDPTQFLGRMLRIFEKILTGIPDGVVVRGNGKVYPPIEELVADIPKLFNPRRTRSDFLPWLASWVALELEPSWNEFQKRKLIEEIISIYGLRGLGEGLHTYLDIYAKTSARPRIAVDDGVAVMHARFADDGSARLQALVQSQVVSFAANEGRGALHRPILVHPVAIAVDSENHYFVVDQGVDKGSDDDALRLPALWKISSTGDIPYVSADPAPLPAPIDADERYEWATAALVDDEDRCSVITIGEPTGISSQNSALHRFEPPDYRPTVLIDQSTSPRLSAVRPVDMVFDGDGNYVILDRGTHLISDPPSGVPAVPRIVLVITGAGELRTDLHPLPSISEPTALVREPGGTYVVADAGNQFADTSISEPADLVRVDPSDDWSTRSLLADLPPERNPLVFPTSLALEGPSSLLVADSGLRWGFEGDQSNRSMAEPAALYRVDLSAAPPTVTRLTNKPGLVHPTSMCMDRAGRVLITDRGDSLRGSVIRRNWRTKANEFGVTVHFSRQRPTTNDERNRVRRGIARVVDEQKPGHTSWWLKSE